MNLVLLLIACYLLGSVPTSIIAGRLARGIDIRQHGSRNPGATNTFRVLGPRIGIAVGIVDIGKGFAAVWFFSRWIPAPTGFAPDLWAIIAGIAAVAGHTFTVFASFKGGKGVGTAFGIFLALEPLPSAVALVVWVYLVWRTGYVSVGSIAAAVILPALVIARTVTGTGSPAVAALVSAIGLLVIWRHRSNMVRLRAGTENRFNTRRFR